MTVSAAHSPVMFMSDAGIEINELTKKYGDALALDHLTLRMPEGKLFGLLGPNGAGKTTTISILCGLIQPTSGSATVGGYNVARESARIKGLIGVCTQTTAVFPYLTGLENVRLFGELQGMPRGDLTANASALLDRMGLNDDAKRKAGGYSEGMKRRLSLAMALVHDPDIAFLDEPTVGMDPQSRLALWDYLRELKARGKTIVLTTHYMEEAEALCDTVGIIDHGQLIALGTPAELREKYDGRNLEDVFIQLTGRKIREVGV
jgi:ABC-2 type transport system ATP-binding protein